MTCEWLICCSDVRTEPDGLLSILGIYGSLTIKTTPHTVPTLTVAVRFLGMPGETADVRIGLYEADGTEVQSQSDRVTSSPYGFLDGAFSFPGFVFSGPTTCFWILHINGHEVHRTPLPILRVT